MVERNLGPEAEERGALVLRLSVLVILLTAPVGAVGIAVLGPLWLTHRDDPPARQPVWAKRVGLRARSATPMNESTVAERGVEGSDWDSGGVLEPELS